MSLVFAKKGWWIVGASMKKKSKEVVCSKNKNKGLMECRRFEKIKNRMGCWRKIELSPETKITKWWFRTLMDRWSDSVWSGLSWDRKQDWWKQSADGVSALRKQKGKSNCRWCSPCCVEVKETVVRKKNRTLVADGVGVCQFVVGVRFGAQW